MPGYCLAFAVCRIDDFFNLDAAYATLFQCAREKRINKNFASQCLDSWILWEAISACHFRITQPGVLCKIEYLSRYDFSCRKYFYVPLSLRSILR